ncbi:HlyD family efflux transporter periplasmic adaptor subunit [Thalassotalea sp. 1_MG-2023]|uniref:efflux RND transporter periplasmic adaptor subunit n=1 Tax=Thalassotalea sp. 1_MG-2023 TaxID=3062680 RepID=UPI0026E25C40|nr:HlyD family efflux transporter periplasmic adaptor subunit [Thalassotalea sp. 1_MG-2023]MDO6425755.1 HlyD family efflux transporter periplasmic adaptor subunit [Thalassotalea sp. 1_MG-2023]
MKKTILLMLTLLAGCSEPSNQPLLYTVKQNKFSIQVPAKGELFAAKATVINAPISRSGSQVLAWLAPEYAFVKQGEIIAKFDGEVMTKNKEAKLNELNMTLQDIQDKSGQLNKELTSINKDITLVGEEKTFADKFAIDDERILSKLEILESMQDSQYLGTKQEYLEWKEGNFSESSSGEMSLLEMKKNQHQTNLNMLKDSLSKLEIKAPHDGMIVYQSNWRGEKSRPGQMYWPGQKIAELPDIQEMKIKLFVAEKEAIDLTKGAPVNFLLNADVSKSFKGTVESISTYPSSIERGDPQKFFEVIVTLEKQQPSMFVPGRKVTATIIIQPPEEKLIVPLQAVFSKNNEQFVWLYTQGKFKKAPVQLGQTSLSHAVIEQGLTSGQEISLVERGES